MNHRERELAAIRHQTPDHIPVDVIGIDNRDAVIEHLKIEAAGNQRSAIEGMYQALRIDGRLGSPRYTGKRPHDAEGNEISEWGCLIGGHHAGRAYPLAEATTVKEVERYSWPDPVRYNYGDLRSWAASLDLEGYAVRVRYWPLLVRGMDLLGMERGMVLMLTEPDIYESVVQRIFEINEAVFQRLIDTLGDSVPILAHGDDFATQRGMMISPGLWRRFFKERWRKLFDARHSAGKIVWFHSCGDITPVLPDLIDIGMDVWETVQLHTLSLTPREPKREYGNHITFFGGICTQRWPFATPAEVFGEVRRCIETLGGNGGYICGPDHHIWVDVSPENTLALFQTATAYRGEGYTTGSAFCQQPSADDSPTRSDAGPGTPGM